MTHEWNPKDAQFQILEMERICGVWTIFLNLTYGKYAWERARLVYIEEKNQTALHLTEGSDMPVAPGVFWSQLTIRIRDHCIDSGWLAIKGYNETVLDATMLDLVVHVGEVAKHSIGEDEIAAVTYDYNRVNYQMKDGTLYRLTLDRRGDLEKNQGNRPQKERVLADARGDPTLVVPPQENTKTEEPQTPRPRILGPLRPRGAGSRRGVKGS